MKLESFRDLMRLVHGFEAAKVFLVANDLDIFARLEHGRTVSELATVLGVDPRALGLLLNALVALGLLEKQDEMFYNSPVTAQYLAADDYRGHIFKHIHHCWEPWSDLAEVVARGAPDQARETAFLHDEESRNRDFIRGMDDVTRDLAPQVAPRIDLGGVRTLLDLGGGPGTYAKAFLEAHPHLETVTIFDLPFALKVARERLATYRRRDDVRLREGDFHADSLGGGYDAVWISQVFHSQDEADCRRLIDKSARALNEGGRLVVHEFLLDESMTAPLTAALFAVHMLVMTEKGRAYGGHEIAGWMAEAGFEGVTVERVSDDTGVVIGRKV